jgi:hypothetical protein
MLARVEIDLLEFVTKMSGSLATGMPTEIDF